MPSLHVAQDVQFDKCASAACTLLWLVVIIVKVQTQCYGVQDCSLIIQGLNVCELAHASERSLSKLAHGQEPSQQLRHG
jgi:hypothetical protein